MMKAVVLAMCRIQSQRYTITRNHKKSAGASGSTSTMMKYILKPNDSSLAATVARMTARDGLPFHVFGTSTDMRSLSAAAGFTGLPKSANGHKTENEMCNVHVHNVMFIEFILF